MQLQFAITMGEQLTPEQVDQIGHPRRCSIGQWLDSPGVARLQNLPVYRDLEQRHVQFHQEMMAIVHLIETERFAEAAIALEQNSRYTQVAMALALAITAFDRVFKVAIPL